MKWFKFDKSSVVNSLIATAVWTVGSFLLNMKKGDGVFEAFVNTMTLEIRLWHVIVFVGVVYVISVIRGLYKKDAVVPQEVPVTKEEPKYLEYTEDTFQGLKWIWNWKKNENDNYNLIDLTPICPLDNVFMSKNNMYAEYPYTCPICEQSILDIGITQTIRTLIKDEIYKTYSVNINI